MPRLHRSFRPRTVAILLIAPLGGCALGDAGGRSRSGYCPVKHGKLYFEMTGSGEPIVLIHGGQMDCRIWDAEVELLRSNYRVIRYDVRGYGRSPAPTEVYSLHEDLARLLDRLEVPKAHLVGLSLGGAAAIDFAIAHPERVGKLVVVV